MCLVGFESSKTFIIPLYLLVNENENYFISLSYIFTKRPMVKLQSQSNDQEGEYWRQWKVVGFSIWHFHMHFPDKMSRYIVHLFVMQCPVERNWWQVIIWMYDAVQWRKVASPGVNMLRYCFIWTKSGRQCSLQRTVYSSVLTATFDTDH